MRRRKGYSKTVVKKRGKWYGRLRIKRPDGTEKDYYSHQAVNKTNARELADGLERKYVKGGDEALDAAGMTFGELVEAFKSSQLIPAIYDGNRKVAGYKQPKKLEGYLNRLKGYFGHKRLAEIRPKDLLEYKSYLLQKKTKHDRQRSIYDVNHHLRALRLVLNFAKLNRWIMETPFAFVRGIVNAAHEMPRQREERPGELERLLAVCTGTLAHLRPWIVLAVETALRPSEIDRLERQDVLFEEGVIVARMQNTKTNQRREVPLTPVLAEELRAWFEFCATADHWAELVPDEPTAPIFGGFKSNKKAWTKACTLAGIENLQRKDLRHWGTTRLVEALRKAGIPELHGMVITGHTRLTTFKRYVTTDRLTVRAARDALDALRKEKTEQVSKPEQETSDEAGGSNEQA